MRYLILFSLAAIMLMGSCKKIRENHLIKDQWELYEAYLNNQYDLNFMEVVLDGYNEPEGCCRYIIDFHDDDEVFGFYYRNDTLDYMIRGEWFMEDKDHLYIDLDRYVKGTFKIEKDGHRDYKLTTEENTGAFGPVELTGPLEMHIYRQKPNE